MPERLLITSEERPRWQQIKAGADQFAAAITTVGEAALAAGLLEAVATEWPQAADRPTAEAVAPYVPPATPAVRSRTKEEAREAIERDWLRQVDNRPDLAREIARTQALAARLGLAAAGLAEVAAAMPDPQFPGSDWLAIKPRLQTAPLLIRPGPFRTDGETPR